MLRFTLDINEREKVLVNGVQVYHGIQLELKVLAHFVFDFTPQP
jgi:hypothetical protein